MPLNSIKNYFWVVLYYFSYKNGPNDLVRGLFSCLDVGTYILPKWTRKGAQRPASRWDIWSNVEA
jgi:hypothetical protein